MFENNLNTIKEKNPQLAEKLKNIQMDSIKDIGVFEAESGDLIIALNNIAQHSPIDPAREAKTVWNRAVSTPLGRNDIQLVFGLGLGYLFKRAFVNADSKVFVLEPSLEVLRFVLEHVDLSKELSEDRVFVASEADEILSKIQKEYLSGDRVEFLFVDQVALSNQKILQELTEKISDIIKDKGSDENTIFFLSTPWTQNFIRNLPCLKPSRPLGYFAGKFNDASALIISAGPSLLQDIEKIGQNREQFVVFAVGKALKTLKEHNIIPDFAVFADAKHAEVVTKGLEDFIEKTNLLLLYKSDNFIFNMKSKSKIIYFSDTDSLIRPFKESDDKNIGFYRSGSSVSILCYYAAKVLGFRNIVFSGLDLAFLENKIYSDGQQIELDEAGKLKIPYQDKHYTKNIVSVKDRNGNDIPSSDDYAWFIRQFGEILSEDESLSKVINTSLKGAYIAGMEYADFSDMIRSLPEKNLFNTDKIIAEVFAKTEKPWNEVLNNVYESMRQTKTSLEEIISDSDYLYQEFKKIFDELIEKGTVEYNAKDYEQLHNKAIQTRKNITGNILSMCALQKFIWEYTRNYIIKPSLSQNELAQNISLDSEFFRFARNHSRCLLALLSSSLEL